MSHGHIIVAELELLLKGWKFYYVNAKDKFGGLLLGWKVNCFHFLNAWAVVSGISVFLYSIEFKMPFWFVNIYGPYLEWEGFWNKLFSKLCIDK